MSYPLYKVLHLLGVLLLFASLGGLLVQQLRGGANGEGGRLPRVTHGIALLLILVAGFGALAKLGVGLPPWAIAKLVVWLLLGAAPVAIRRLPGLAPLLWWALPILGAAAAFLAVYKPGG